MNVDFDYLKDLFKQDPEEFERQTREMIDETIDQIDDENIRRRLRGIQFTLDHKLSKCKDPIVRYNEMIRLFWQQFTQFHIALTSPSSIHDQQHTAKVYKFENTASPKKDAC